MLNRMLETVRISLHRRIAAAAPTCTLWVPMLSADGYSFLFNPGWTINNNEVTAAQEAVA